jgi:hypothetical protein
MISINYYATSIGIVQSTDLNVFNFAFGALRQAIWRVSPAMRREMLRRSSQ